MVNQCWLLCNDWWRASLGCLLYSMHEYKFALRYFCDRQTCPIFSILHLVNVIEMKYKAARICIIYRQVFWSNCDCITLLLLPDAFTKLHHSCTNFQNSFIPKIQTNATRMWGFDHYISKNYWLNKELQLLEYSL